MASAFQLTLVDLMCALSTLQTDTVLHLVKEVVRRPQIRGDQVRSLGDLPMNSAHSPNAMSYKCIWEENRSQEQLGIGV